MPKSSLKAPEPPPSSATVTTAEKWKKQFKLLNAVVADPKFSFAPPTGGSIGIGFAVPSKTVVAVVDQLRQFKEVRRGGLGVRIQQVTDEIADSLSIKPARGALIAGVDDKGPAKPAGIEPGDVVIKFDGKDIKAAKAMWEAWKEENNDED